MDNPFIFNGYRGAEYFFDREKEMGDLLDFATRGVNVTLISQRRMGKTGLVFRLFDEIKRTGSSVVPIYVDIFATRDLADLIHTLASAIMQSFPENTGVGKHFVGMLKGLRPIFGFDPLSGTPQLQFSYQNQTEKEHTLEGLLQFMEQQGKPILLAIDEFQQIREYKEESVEAMLRTYMQRLHNVRFIFCGSRKHLMADIFSNPQRPFFSSTQFVGLGSIAEERYFQYVHESFSKGGMAIDDDAVRFILQWTRRHTYYTQRVCHEVYNAAAERITVDDCRRCCEWLLEMNEPYFLQYKQLLTPGQWNYLIALAKEERVELPYASSFLRKHNIGATAVARRQLQTLVEKDMVFQETTKEHSYYAVTDLFLMRWLAREY